MNAAAPLLSVIIPVYNESGNVPLMHQRLQAVLPAITEHFEILWVNDGSKDDSLPLLKGLSLTDPRNRYLSFSRNFGHQVALTAGLAHCRGAAAVLIDGDLQDPPELIPELYKKYKEGYKVVYAQRRSRAGEPAWRKTAIRLFYRLLQKTTRIHIPVDTGDFRILDRQVIDALQRMPEQHKFLRGQIAWVGFKQAPVFYDREERHAGKSNYGFGKLLKLALDGFTGFSDYPLRIATVSGFIVSFIAFIIILYALYSKFVQDHLISGWTSLIISTMFIGGVQLITIGIIGEYIGRINSDVRKRPLYIIEEESEQGK